MKSTLLLAAILLLAPCRGGSTTTSKRGQLYDFHYENVLGTSLEIKVVAASPAQSEKAEKAVLAEFERESHILSSWDPDSEFSSWLAICWVTSTSCSARRRPGNYRRRWRNEYLWSHQAAPGN